MTDFLRQYWPSALVLAGVALFLLLIARPVHRRHVKGTWLPDDVPQRSLDAAVKREREEADIDVA